MALVAPDGKRRLLPRRRQTQRPIVSQRPRMTGLSGRQRSLVAAAQTVSMRDRAQARSLKSMRMVWQQDALAYADTIPEVSFAYRFLANCSRRMRIFPAIINPEDPDGEPLPLDQAVKHIEDLPPGLARSCEEAMNALGVGQEPKAQIMEDLAYGLGIAGECWLLGRPDPDTETETWTIRSIDELQVTDDGYRLRELPSDPAGQQGWEPLTPDECYVARIWIPDHRFKALATSPMKACLDVCEELLLLGRDVRAVARSRLNGGILKVPEGLSLSAYVNDQTDPEADPFIGPLGEMMMTPISDEGVASAVVPGVVRGTSEELLGLQHMLIERPYSALALELRTEAIGRLANGIDLPRAIILGLETVNHWGQWLISEDTFRHHVEPGVIRQVGGLTKAFLQPWLESDDIPPYWVTRCVVWYDPVELVTHTDRTGDALKLHQEIVISDKALREAAGFSDEDKPSPIEIEERMVRNTRTFPPNVLEALFHVLDPQLKIPPIEKSGMIPGMSPEGAIEPVTPATNPGAITRPPPPAPAASPGPAPTEPSAGAGGAPPMPSTVGPAEATSSVPTVALAVERATPEHLRLSRRLVQIDAELRAKLQVAANAAMTRALERAGAKVRTKLQRSKDVAVRASIDGVENRLVPSTLGRSMVAAIGFVDAHALLDTNWSELEEQFKSWVRAAVQQQVKVASKLAGITPDSVSAQAAAAKMLDAVAAGWTAFSGQLDAIAERLLYNPAPTAMDVVEFNPNTVVSMNAIRSALSIIGGKPAAGSTPTSTTGAIPSTPTAPVTQLGNGPAVSGMLQDAGMETASYEWVHNYGGPHPFEPHEDLDGLQYSSFTTEALANSNDWPPTPYYMPGDHEGCVCDYACLWVPGVADTLAGTTAAEGVAT